jgi:hypothetical protein
MKKLLLGVGVGVGASSPTDLINCLTDASGCTQVVKIDANGGSSGSIETPHEYGKDAMYMFEVAVPTDMTHIEWSFDEFEVDWSDDDACSHDQVYIFDNDNNAMGPFCGFDDAFADPGSINYDYQYDSHLGNHNLGDAESGNSQNFPLRIGLISDGHVINYGFKISYSSMVIPCDDGYMYVEEVCVDANECDGEGDGNTCDVGQCVNSEGSHQCGCDSGYEVIDQACADVDECATNDGGCTGDSYCSNSIGSFECVCNVIGYGYSDGVCSDIDECTTGQCNVAATCENFDPGYSCVCPDGFGDPNGDGSTCPYENYPTGWHYVPSFDATVDLYISGDTFTDQLSVFMDAGANGAEILLCEEYYHLPYGLWQTGLNYPCSDAVQRFTVARYTNQGGANCYFRDYYVYCNTYNELFTGYIARSSSVTLMWDNDVIGAYEYDSNEVGMRFDTSISGQSATFAEAAEICAAHGARLFNEEVDLWGSTTDCPVYWDLYSKAHGRLYQIPKMIDGFTGQVFTGYRANDAGDNWCYFDGTTCHDTRIDVSIGAHIDPAHTWDAPNSGDPNCNDQMIADAINAALQSEISSIGPVVAGRCLLFDLASNQMVSASCDSEAQFVCEREQWDCDNNSPCSDICNPAGYCECPGDMFLTDFFTCTAIPDLTDIECHQETMVAWFSVEEINNAGTLSLNDTNCNLDSLHINQIGNRFRVETRLDECGTQVSYDADAKTLTFSNALMNGIDMTAVINMETRVSNNFQCVYSSVVDVDDVNLSAEVERSDMEKSGLGAFGFELNLWTNDGFSQAITADNHRVGETLYFTVTQNPVLSNVVFRTSKCSVFNSNREHEYVLFDATTDNFDPFVEATRYRPTYPDMNGETCSSEIVDRYSYTVFEFLEDEDSTIHIDCSIEVCVKEDDMTHSGCNTPCDSTPFGDSTLG